jgi:hypothetical protein
VGRRLTDLKLLNAPLLLLTMSVGEIPVPPVVLAITFNLWNFKAPTAGKVPEKSG